MSGPKTLTRDISPPPTSRKASGQEKPSDHGQDVPASMSKVEDGKGDRKVDPMDVQPTLAAIEAGQAQIRDHLEYFAKHLSEARRPSPGPRLSIADFRGLYNRNQHVSGRHFVVHQHDHPISGIAQPHMREATSTVSFAIPYGLPGNPNSQRPNRMAIETRVHNLWNNLIESASHATGSLLIWDAGEYEVLDRPTQTRPTRTTDDEVSEDEDHPAPQNKQSQTDRLVTAFQSRHLHLRLHGTRLPRGYTIALRLPRNESAGKQPKKPRTKRRRIDPTKEAELAQHRARANDTDTASDSNEDAVSNAANINNADDDVAIASEGEGTSRDEQEQARIRANNAYPGAMNSIGSIHQRHWFLTLDRRNSGFYKARTGSDAGRWVGAFETFFVMGREEERSVVTGRTADEVMRDEGVEAFVGRKMWRPIVE